MAGIDYLLYVLGPDGGVSASSDYICLIPVLVPV